MVADIQKTGPVTVCPSRYYGNIENLMRFDYCGIGQDNAKVVFIKVAVSSRDKNCSATAQRMFGHGYAIIPSNSIISRMSLAISLGFSAPMASKILS